MRKTFALTISLLFVTCSFSRAQNNNAEIIKKALYDELRRSMDSLITGNDNEPCFMSFTVTDAKIMVVSSTLGALINSNVEQTLSFGSRFIVGDYHINDENFNFNDNSEFKYTPQIQMPYKPDYWGIRRALWSSTEKMIKNATKSYKAKKTFLEHNNIGREDYLIPDYSQAPVEKLKAEDVNIEFDVAYWENIARSVSKVFAGYPEVTGSGVSASIMKTTSYFSNSEGTEYTSPNSLVNFEIYAVVNDSNNNACDKTISFTGRLVKDLPSTDSLKRTCHHLVSLLKKEIKTERLEESYSGPVLFENEAASRLLLNTFFSHNGLIAKREPLNARGYDFQMPTEPESNSTEAKMGKKIVAEHITVKSLPKLKKYQGIELWGSFDFDGEGVVPADELTLIENGTLKMLLNDRVPTFASKKSTGHNRSKGLWGNSIDPGVLQVIAKNNISSKAMKQELIKLAKENGNDYCFIVRKQPNGTQRMVYKVNLENGKETLMNTGRIGSIKLKDLKNKVLFSDKEQVKNIARGGIFTSVISSDALIVKDFDIHSLRKSKPSKPSAVENPVAVE